jgi:uncharacterized protein YndB with AHSA1/START domain
MNPLRIELDVEIGRPVADVFAAWSSAEALASWFAPMAVSKPIVDMKFQVGGRYAIEMHLPEGAVFTTRGVFRRIVPDEEIVMTWHCDAFPDPETVVTVRFVAIAGGTRVSIIHEGFEMEATCTDHGHGWQACLAELRSMLTADWAGRELRP